VRAPVEEQRVLLELQQADATIDRLTQRRANLPEEAKLAELETALAAIDQLSAERDGTLATTKREQAKLEADVDGLNRKADAEEGRAAAGKVNSPRELTAIQNEVASLRKRVSTLEDSLLELMQTRETLEGELAELARRREAVVAERTEVTAARDAAAAELDRALEAERATRAKLAPRVGEALTGLYDKQRARSGGVGAAALVGDTCQGCRMRLSPVEAKAARQLPPEEIKRCEHCRRILVIT
jgi:predicted  nucleic acid-binding Zn-ribbon protein